MVLGDMKVNGGEIDESKVKAPNMFERAKEEFDAVVGAIHQRKSSKFVFFRGFNNHVDYQLLTLASVSVYKKFAHVL